MTETAMKDDMVAAFLAPIGFTDAADFHDCWKKLYIFVATDGSIPQLVFDTNDDVHKPLQGRTVSIQNGHWVPRTGGAQSNLLCFVEHKEGTTEPLFSIMSLEDGTGDVLVLTTDGRKVFSEDDRLVVEGCVLSLKEYLRVVPVAKHTAH